MDLANNALTGYCNVEKEVPGIGVHMSLAEGIVESGMTTDVLDYFPEALSVLEEIARMLRPGGAFWFTIPFLWPLHNVPQNEHCSTLFAMEHMLASTRFTEAMVRVDGGCNESLPQMNGLQVWCCPMSARKRRIPSILTLPLPMSLLRYDHVPELRSSPTVPGLSGTAIS